MESRNRGNRVDDDPNERKMSRGLVRHVLTRNTSDRIALGKVTRQLDKERIAKELEFQHQKQKLLLQTFETQMKERFEKEGHQSDSDMFDDSAAQKLADLRIAPGKALNSRGRSYSEHDPSSLHLRGLKCPVQSREGHERKESLHSRETVEKERGRARKTGVINVREHPAIAEEKTLKRTKTLSEILPPIILPPIHKSCTSPLERRKNPEHQRMKAKGGCEGDATNKTPIQIDDLEDCRYLRKSKFS